MISADATHARPPCAASRGAGVVTGRPGRRPAAECGDSASSITLASRARGSRTARTKARAARAKPATPIAAPPASTRSTQEREHRDVDRQPALQQERVSERERDVRGERRDRRDRKHGDRERRREREEHRARRLRGELARRERPQPLARVAAIRVAVRDVVDEVDRRGRESHRDEHRQRGEHGGRVAVAVGRHRGHEHQEILRPLVRTQRAPPRRQARARRVGRRRGIGDRDTGIPWGAESF
jgi:hypothetical protein